MCRGMTKRGYCGPRFFVEAWYKVPEIDIKLMQVIFQATVSSVPEVENLESWLCTRGKIGLFCVGKQRTLSSASLFRARYLSELQDRTKQL